MKKKALLSSILTIALCLSLIAGSTFALFTSESKVNVAVTSGKVNVVATIENLNLYSPTTISENGSILNETNAATETNFKNGGTASLVENKLTLTNITPGDKVTFDVKITNNSNVTIQYRSIVEKIVDTGLWAGLKVSIDGTEYHGETKKSAWTTLAVDSAAITVPVEIELPATAGNVYQEKSCELAYKVEAVQGNAEMPVEWDGESVEAPTVDPDTGVYHINNAAEFMGLMNNAQSGSSVYYSKKIVLNCDINLGGATIPGFGNEGCIFAGSFDGQGHTVSNFKIDRADKSHYAGLFNYYSCGTLENLNIKNATVIGYNQVGILVGAAESNGATVNNCTVEDCVVIANQKVGGAIGYVADGTVKKCSVKNTTVYCAVTTQAYGKDQWGEVIGYKNIGLVEGTGEYANTSENVSVIKGITYVADGVMLQDSTYLISNAAGLQYCATTFNTSSATAGKTFQLTADIDMAGIDWEPWCNDGANNFSGTFDGQNKTIKNLSIDKNDDTTPGHSAAFIGWLVGTVKNVTFDNASVKGHHYVAVAVGYNQAGTIDGVKVTNSAVVATCVKTAENDEPCGDKVGAVVGMLGPNGDHVIVKNCTAENCTIKAARDAGQVIGMAYTGNILSNNVATNVTVSEVEHNTCTGANITNDIIGRQ